MRLVAKRLVVAAAALGSLLLATRIGHANTSGWSDKVGFIGDDNSTTWCETSLNSTGASSHFRRVDSDSTHGFTSPVVASTAAQMVRVVCASGGSTQVVTASGWSTDPGGDTSSAKCNSGWTPTLAECRVDGHVDNGPATTLPYVYQGSACGNGIASINTSTLVSELLDSSSLPSSAQFAPYQPFSTLNAVSPLKTPNNTSSVNVGGADIGTPFFDSGVLNIAFGDTFTSCTGCNTINPSGNGYRAGTLAKTSNLDPTGGLVVQSWEPTANGIFTPEAGLEASVVAGAGFAVTSGGVDTRVIWYFSVNQWQPFLANGCGLATSTNGGPWQRGAGPVWPWNSNFGPGAIWQDRYNQWIYFFGVRPQMETTVLAYSGVRVARVPSNINSILDPKQYQYWSGSTWVTDTTGNFAPAIPADQGGMFGPEADLLSATALPRSEISVAYDSFANVWMMMYLNENDRGVRLLVSLSITGPWVEVLFDTFSLPNTALLPSPPPLIYAPFTSDHLLLGAGSDVYYMLSEFFPVYNVGMWHFTINRNTSCSLTP